jgi:hypothetical protein
MVEEPMQKLFALGLIGVGAALGQAADHLPAGPAMAQPRAQKDCPWPANLDAVTAAPKNHKVLLENERVRVLDVTVLPGEREQVHAHCLPSVMYLMQEGVYRDYDAQGRLVEEVKEALPASKFPMTLWLEPQAPHAVHNLDAKPTRLIRIELKK